MKAPAIICAVVGTFLLGLASSAALSQEELQRPQADALPRTNQKIADLVSAMDFNIVADGRTDQSTKINAALAAFAASGGALTFPASSSCYFIANPINLTQDGVTIRGDNQKTTKFCYPSGYRNVALRIGSSGSNPARVLVSDVGFVPVSGFAGGAVAVYVGSGNDVQLSRIEVDNTNVAIQIENDPPTTTTFGIYLYQPFLNACGTACILIGAETASGTSRVPTKIVVRDGNLSGHDRGSDCIVLSGIADFDFYEVSTLFCNHGLLIAPGARQTVQVGKIVASYFDSSYTYGALLTTRDATAKVVNLELVGDWFGSNGGLSSPSGPSSCTGAYAGLRVDQASGLIGGIQVTGGQSVNNCGPGIDLVAGSYMQFYNHQIEGNSQRSPGTLPGFRVGAATSHIQISGGTSGASALGFGKTQSYGYEVANGADYVTITGTDGTGNASGSVKIGAVPHLINANNF